MTHRYTLDEFPALIRREGGLVDLFLKTGLDPKRVPERTEMKYTAHMQCSEHAGMEVTTEFEVDPAEIEGLDGDALDSFLWNSALEALTETTVTIWHEED